MTRSFDIVYDGQSDRADTVIKTLLPDAVGSVTDLFIGDGLPDPSDWPFRDGQLCADRTSKLIYQWHASSGQWRPFAPLFGQAGRRTLALKLGALAADVHRLVAPAPMRVTRVGLVPSASTSDSSGNEWTFALQNVSEAQALFSGTVGTFTTLAGVGGGDLVADTAYWLLADQNQELAEGDVLTLTVAAVGSPTAVGDVTLVLDGYEIGI